MSEQTKKQNVFVRLGRMIATWCGSFHKRFVNGTVGTKISHFVMGAGNIYHKQYVKGALFFVIQVLFVLFMVLCPQVNETPLGYQALVNLGTLGYDPTPGEIGPDGLPKKVPNSMLILLFGVVTIGVIALYLITWFANISSSAKADEAVRMGGYPTDFKKDLADLLDKNFHVTMLAPTVIGVLLFTVLPTIYMILVAFTNYGGVGASSGQVNFGWVGLDNFVNVFSNPNSEIGQRFLSVLSWTLVWAFFATFTNYFGGIFLAVLINQKGVKGKVFFRTVFILTIAIPQFISLLAMRNLLSANGPINSTLMSWGWISEPINFLGHDSGNSNEFLIKTVIILINMWVGIPYTMLMTSGILMNIPSDLYEAAKIDGANPVQTFFKITFPYIFFITTPYLISSFIGNITSFNIIFMLSGGGPAVAGYKAGKTDLLVTWLYKLTVNENMYNEGAVIGIFTFIITSVITLVTYRRSKSYKEEDTFQ